MKEKVEQLLCELLPGKNRIPDVVIIINKICDKHDDKCDDKHDDDKHDRKHHHKHDRKHDDDKRECKDKKKHSKKDKDKHKDKDKKHFQKCCDFEIKILKETLDDDFDEKDKPFCKHAGLELVIAPSIPSTSYLTDSLGKSIGRRKNRGYSHS